MTQSLSAKNCLNLRSKNDTLSIIMFRFISLLGLSLALHFISALSLNWVPNPKSIDRETVVVELVDQNKTAENQSDFEKPVVKNTTETPASEMKNPAEFVAEKNQRFEKQTKAQKLGVFRNADTKTQKGQKKIASDQPQQTNNSDDGVPEFAKVLQNQVAQTQASSVPFELPEDIAQGAATNLNADAHIYASFYNRVIELFYVRWAERLDAIWSHLSTDFKRQLSGKSWTTDVEIWLDSTGVYQKGFITKKSGYAPFDQAGINAFRSAQFFPNPPKAKVEADGVIRLRYRISVHTR